MANVNLSRTKGKHKVRMLDFFTCVIDLTDEAPKSISADTLQLAQLPDRVLVFPATLIIETAWDGTSAAADIGIDGGDELFDGFDLQSTAGVYMQASPAYTAADISDPPTEAEVQAIADALEANAAAGVGLFLSTGGVLTFLPTYTGDDQTEGKATLVVPYLELDRANGNFTRFVP